MQPSADPASKVVLQTNDPHHVLELRNIRRSSCELRLDSRGFAFRGRFFYDHLDVFCEDLERLSLTLQGEATLKEDYGDSFIKLNGAGLGRMAVSGHVVEHSDMPQILEFEFKTDQTCLAPLLRDLRAARDASPTDDS